MLPLLLLLACGGTEAESPVPAETPLEPPVPTASDDGVSRVDDPASACGYAFAESHSLAAHGEFAVKTDKLDCEYDGVYTAGAGIEVRWKAATGMATMKLGPGGCNGADAAATVIVEETAAADCPKAFSAAREVVKAGKLPAPVALK